MVERSLLLFHVIVIISGIINVKQLFQISSPLKRNVIQNEVCDLDLCHNCSMNSEKSGMVNPYIAPGPSKIQELVPMSILQKKVQLNSYDGLKYLDHTSLSEFYQCHPSDKTYSNSSIKWCSQRTFRHIKSPLIALISFHGSGNTWLRYLLEQATGIFTGSIYCDGLLKSVFPGESIASGNVIAIKTHNADTRALPIGVQVAAGREKYHKAILLVRNPFDALISEANRRWNSIKSINGHIGLADETSFISKLYQ